MNLQPYYTPNTLAEECGTSLRNIQRHLKAGTCKLNKAAERIPGVGVRINGQLAAKFIQVMKAKKLSTHVSV
jgi:hypothetical protein